MGLLARDSTPVKDGISFGELELCVINVAFNNPDNGSALAELREEFPDAYTRSETRYFEGASRMSFRISDFAIFLGEMMNLLFSEIEQLKSELSHSILPCGHPTEDHRAALVSVTRKVSLSLSPPV